MPVASLQQVLPYSVAVSGLQLASATTGKLKSQPGMPPAPATAAAAAGKPGTPVACLPSIAAAIAAAPQLSIFKTVVGLAGVSGYYMHAV